MKLNSNYIVAGEEEKEKKNIEESGSLGNGNSSSNNNNNNTTTTKVTPKIQFSSNTSSSITEVYRSSPLLGSDSNISGSGSSSRNAYGKIGFMKSVGSASFSLGKSATTTIRNDFGFELSAPMCSSCSCTSDASTNKVSEKKAGMEMIDVSNQNMEACGMKECEVFVPCAILETDESVELLLPGAIKEESTQAENESGCINLQINETSCVVSHRMEECMQLIPVSIARVSDDMDLQVLSTESKGSNCSKHTPQIEGCVMIQHKPVLFAVHLYEYPNDCTATIIEFQRRSGDPFIFEKFYEGCLEQFRKIMKDLRNCNYYSECTSWSILPNLDSLTLNGLAVSETCWWDQSCLDLLANLIREESQEAVDMLGSLCDAMEKHKSLRKQVLQHKVLMEQMITQVLTHQDKCFVRLGLVALYTSLGGEKMDSVKEICQSNQTLAFIIALLNSGSMFVLRHAVRLLALLASICECPWKLNESQKKTLNDCIPRVEYHLLETSTWSATYATETFITKDMFERIVFHPTV